MNLFQAVWQLITGTMLGYLCNITLLADRSKDDLKYPITHYFTHLKKVLCMCWIQINNLLKSEVSSALPHTEQNKRFHDCLV